MLLAAGAGGCASYNSLPLDDNISIASPAARLTVDTRDIPFPALAAHKFDPSDGLDMTEVAMLAVANNPSLKLARDDARIGRAQAFAAGLLPDPQISFSQDFPHQSGPGVTSAYNAGLSYDVGVLISHGAAFSSSSAESRKTDLALLWQEWQVIAQSRILFLRVVSQNRLLILFEENHRLRMAYYSRMKKALDEDNITADAASPVFLAWRDALRQESDLKRQRQQTRASLNALLGLAPDTTLTLVEDTLPTVPDEKEVTRALGDLPRRRPDLMAFKAGYDAQDARYRQAILAQFPPFNIGITLARDTGGVVTSGYAVSFLVPLLNGNRGAIRVEQATRQRLHDEYNIRLNAAYAEVKNLLADRRLITAQLDDAELALPSLEDAAANGQKALAEGNIDFGAYSALESARIAKQIEVENLRQALQEVQIGLLSLLGGDFAPRSSAQGGRS